MMPFAPFLERHPGPEPRFLMALPPDLMAFQGHFPTRAILPGVVQVDWAARLGEESFGPLGAFKGFRRLKFQGLLQPGDQVELRLRHDPAQGTLTFVYATEIEQKSSGTLLFSTKG